MKTLFEQPQTFDFFQAVRLLELAARGSDHPGAVGTDAPPERESLRFRTRPSLAFAISEVQKLTRAEGDRPTEMQVNFLGFVGAAGMLPQHYTESVIERLQLKDATLRDFLDVFQHRSISLFYRAWSKYRFPIAFERQAHEPGQRDPFTRAIHSLVGLGLAPLQRRQALDDSVFAYAGGHFTRRVRSAAGLQRALEEVFGVPARVHEFVGRWLTIPDEERCCLPHAHEHGDHRVQLGGGATLGARVWEIQSQVAIDLGPLSLSSFERLRPGGARHAALLALTRTYLGLDHDFVLQLVLDAGQSRGIQLLSGAEAKDQLGRSTWLDGSHASNVRHEASFACDLETHDP